MARRIKKAGVKWLLVAISAVFLLLVVSGAFMPKPLFEPNYSTVLESESGELLGARIAADEQWRFPPVDSIPLKYEKCLLAFEDRYFYWHPGVNLLSITRAFAQNIRAGKIVSGGSTISMQVCRLARGAQKRSVKNKLIEMLWAINLEIRLSKEEILLQYASHAPFGGNVVGIDAASWRYFGRDCQQLSWAEAATLAVLPNAPALIYPGRHDNRLKEKRDKLLKNLLCQNELDSLTYELAISEPLPQGVNALPNAAFHLTQKLYAENKGEGLRSTIDANLQKQVNQLVNKHQAELKGNFIHNLAVLVAQVPSKKVLAYVGNSMANNASGHGNQVDVIQASRSTGSILKPFLYCKMLDEGLITPFMLVPDIPMRFGGFTPMNFDREYNGAVAANEALARSLNIPAVHMLREFGVAPFHSFLQKTGMSSLTKNADHYGLSLILGGAEVKLWDLVGMYTSLASILKQYNQQDGFYASNAFEPLLWKADGLNETEDTEVSQPIVRASSIFATFNALLNVSRPESEEGWELFASSKKIAWKTGTSFGFRDAWAVGVSSNYVVGVWVGNADGEGRPGLTGISAAAPVLFDVFAALPDSPWFEEPSDEFEEVEVCEDSGYRAGQFCVSSKKVRVPSGNKVGVCKWHKRVHLNKEANHRVNSNCYPVAQMQHQNRFVLPPAMEYYYKQNNASYSVLPPLLPGCSETIQQMEFIYPREWNKLFIPVDLDGTPGKLIFELAHRQKHVMAYWYLDNTFVGKTELIHQLEITTEPGWHKLSVTDAFGNSVSKSFFVTK